MFDQIFDAIEEWMRELLTGMINSNLDQMFTDVNQKTGEIASQVGQTPQKGNEKMDIEDSVCSFHYPSHHQPLLSDGYVSARSKKRNRIRLYSTSP